MALTKSAYKIERLRESAELVGRTLGQIARYIEPGVTTRELDRIAEAFIRDHGAEPAFKGYRVGNLVFPSTLCTSVNDTIVHGIPDDSPLQQGDLLSVDCGVRLNGYYGDSAYTFAVGGISDEKRALCETTYAALYKGIEHATTGRRVGDISFAIQEYCESRGYGVVRELVGHGIGKKLHEKPNVPNVGEPATGSRLVRGMTLCIEPMINLGTARIVTDPNGWAIRAADGKAAAHYEHMVVVCAGQAEVLSTFEYIEEVSGVAFGSPTTYKIYEPA
ncbi:MAG: type I methionyl aminopeptidase [Bacteroidetes bacterium SB0662_bin_6]|nr:type I methionyl aminopeptidase [Bacteroidetes bacterium SB0668_bin_1]MYE04355.1 type I methionyl aminopeptidase [Bacteroidetes bacterium SB0662_bin_6]